MLQNSISHYATSPSFKTTVSNNQKNNSSTRLSNPSLVFDSINHFNLTESFKVNKGFFLKNHLSKIFLKIF